MTSSEPPRALILAVSGGPLRGKKAAIRPGEALVVGRSEQAAFTFPKTARIEARHFEITWDGAVPRVRDLESRDGTRLDGQPITDSEARHASWIRAGDLDFTLHIEAHTPPDEAAEEDALPGTPKADSPTPDSLPRAATAPAASTEGPPEGALADAEDPFPTEDPEPQDGEGAFYAGDNPEARWNAIQAAKQARIDRALREGALSLALPLLESLAAKEPLHAVLDAARTPRILTLLRESVEEHRSLYEGTAGEALDDVAPHHVRLAGGSRLLRSLLIEGWSRRWGIFLEGDVRERDLRRHLRRFLLVEEEDTRERLYFRYYDPSALLSVWATCSRRQRDDLLGPLRAYLVEGPRGEVLRLTADRDIESLTAPQPR